MSKFPPVDDQLALIKRGVIELITEGELRAKLERSRKTGRPLIIKAGFDPTAPDLHMGHTVLLRKMRHFEQLGHQVIFLIGDFTGRIGDPSGLNEQRRPMTAAHVQRNANTYKTQVFTILDHRRTQVRFNSEWFSKLSAEQLAQLCGHFTAARIMERDDFQQRLQLGNPLSMLELLYPVLQAYDSVMLEADVELGGTDQRFNLLMGRRLQPDFGQASQVVLLMPLLEGTDGLQKMSKSLGNSIGINDAPHEMFGKTMSIPDPLTVKYAELLTDLELEPLKAMHPMEAKKHLAHGLVRLYHGAPAADRAQAHFERVFQQRQTPEAIDTVTLTMEAPTQLVELLDQPALRARLAAAVPSKSAFRRLIRQGGLRLDGRRVTNVDVSLEPGKAYLLQLGRRHFLRLHTDR